MGEFVGVGACVGVCVSETSEGECENACVYVAVVFVVKLNVLL